MKPLRYGVFAMMVALAAIAHTQAVKAGDQLPAKERFIGAWHLAQIDSQEAQMENPPTTRSPAAC